MASRAYRRDNRGQFAGASGGTKVTYGKAGGFANAAFRGRVQAQRSSAKAQGGSKAPKGRGKAKKSRFLTTKRKSAIKAGVTAGALGLVASGIGAAAARGVIRAGGPVGMADRAMISGKKALSNGGKISGKVAFSTGGNPAISGFNAKVGVGASGFNTKGFVSGTKVVRKKRRK